jgi:hypothetical protein
VSSKTATFCGFVISWPVQKEGWCGAPRVLHTRPDHRAVEQYHQPQPPGLSLDGDHRESEDAWGRMALTAKLRIRFFTSHPNSIGTMTLRFRCLERLCRNHWPELYQEQPAMEEYMVASGKQPAPICRSGMVGWTDTLCLHQGNF